jgi:pimeloyl-ACP methyl ester carboxylesterase
MADLKSYKVESAAGTQHYLAAGSGTPLVMLHGLGANAASWNAVAAAFSDAYRVVIPDLAGHGASEPFKGEINFALQLAGLEAILHAECQEPAIYVGHSLGGWLGCLLTFNHPESVLRVVLVNGPLKRQARTTALPRRTPCWTHISRTQRAVLSADFHLIWKRGCLTSFTIG